MWNDLATADSSRHAYLVSWIADFPDPFGFLDMLFGSNRPDNYGGFSDGFVDLLLALASSEPRHERRLALYRLAESRIVERGAVVPHLSQRVARARATMGDAVPRPTRGA